MDFLGDDKIFAHFNAALRAASKKIRILSEKENQAHQGPGSLPKNFNHSR